MESLVIAKLGTITAKLRAKLRNTACKHPVLPEAYGNSPSWFPCVNISTGLDTHGSFLLHTSVSNLRSCYLEVIRSLNTSKEPDSLHSVTLLNDGNVAELFQSLPEHVYFLSAGSWTGRPTKRLTLYGVPRRRLASPLRLIADPLLAALPRDFDPARCLAPHARGLRLGAQAHAANGAVHAHALVLAVRREALPVAVDDAVMFAAGSRHV